ncbi:MAG: hypothetical protein JXB30_18040 [Anaerolineae bacterium]|nr:hypothetical protein [Anaerolineae bacterium]
MPMNDLIPILFVGGFIVLFLVLVIGSNLLGARRFAERTARLEQQTLERGWEYLGFREGGVESHTFNGETDGVSWQLESYYRRSSSSSSRGSGSSTQYTRWWTESVKLSDDVVLLLPSMGKTFQAFGAAGAMVPGELKGFAGSLIQMFLRFFVTNVLRAAPDDARVFDNIRQIQAGSDALRQRYTILATSDMVADRFLDEDAEQMLLELAPEKWSDAQSLRVMAIVYWHRGIQLVIEDQIVDIDKLEQIVRLGVALVSGQKSSVWS